MTNSIEITKSEKKDHWNLNINGVILGEWERSQIRDLIGILDNEII